MREVCRIQTIPDDYVIEGGRAEVQRQVGNAVASLMGEILGREIRHQFFGDKKDCSKLKLMPTKQLTTPRAKRITKVPDQYLDLIGEHAAHPGTGLGPVALKRKAEALKDS